MRTRGRKAAPRPGRRNLLRLDFAVLLCSARGECDWKDGELEHEYCCGGINGPQGVPRCWDGGAFIYERCCGRARPGWELGGYAGEFLMPTRWFNKDVYYNMSTYVKYIEPAGLQRYAKDHAWLMPLTVTLSRLNHALVQMRTCCTFDFLSWKSCSWVTDKRSSLAQLEDLGEAFHREMRAVLRFLGSKPNLTRTTALDNTGVWQLARGIVVHSLARVWQVSRTVDQLGQDPDAQSLLARDLDVACRWFAKASVLAGYRLHAQAWFADGRLGAETVREATFREDLGLTRMQVISSLISMLEEEVAASEANQSSLSRRPHRPLEVAEIGVMMGATGSHLLKTHRRLHWLGLDTYEGIWTKNQPVASKALEPYAARARLWNIRSEAVTDEQVPRASLDLVFVDGDHSEEQVTLDLEHWAPRVRSGGIVAGHDYYDENYDGVTVAVHRLLPPGAKLEVAPDHVFFWRAP